MILQLNMLMENLIFIPSYHLEKHTLYEKMEVVSFLIRRKVVSNPIISLSPSPLLGRE